MQSEWPKNWWRRILNNLRENWKEADSGVGIPLLTPKLHTHTATLLRPRTRNQRRDGLSSDLMVGYNRGALEGSC